MAKLLETLHLKAELLQFLAKLQMQLFLVLAVSCLGIYSKDIMAKIQRYVLAIHCSTICNNKLQTTQMSASRRLVE